MDFKFIKDTVFKTVGFEFNKEIEYQTTSPVPTVAFTKSRHMEHF